MRLHRLLAPAVIALVACGTSEKPLCTPPPRTTYSCETVPTGTPNSCAGGPLWQPLGTDAALHQDDPDKTFPEFCQAEIPDCSLTYMGSARGFQCRDGNWGEE